VASAIEFETEDGRRTEESSSSSDAKLEALGVPLENVKDKNQVI